MRAAGLWALGSGQRDCLFILPEPSAQCPAAVFNSAPQKAIEHRHLHHHSIEGLANDDAARSVEDFVGDRDVASYRQTMHEMTVAIRILEPRVLHAPVAQVFAQARISLV